jgi:beta-lactamase regulating signal transducer with metallopeptidase domain
MSDLLFASFGFSPQDLDASTWLLLWHVVQVTIVALVVWPLARAVSSRNAHVAHLLWALVLIKCLTPPVLAAPTSPFCWVGESQASAVAVESEVVSAGLIVADRVALPAVASSQNRAVGESDVARGSIEQLPVSTEKAPRAKTKAMAISVDASLASLGKQTSVSVSQVVAAVVFVIWILGVLISLLIAGVRLSQLRLKIRNHSLEPSKTTLRLTESLRRRLGVRQRVQIKILRCELGPAVAGFFRPTILLPQSLERALSPNELEAVIAHELIHFRRGDLGWAVLQTACSCLFWFHPLVWLAVNELTVQSERCCDEQTVAGLGCSPAQYVSGLMSVLEHKVRLKAIPALPGMRTVDITSKRLERVMNFKDEMKKRTPVMAWLVFLIGGLMALPGAAWVAAQSPQAQPPVLSESETETQKATEPVEVRVYDVSVHKQRALEEGYAKSWSPFFVLPMTASQMQLSGGEPVRVEIAEYLNEAQRSGLPASVTLGGKSLKAKFVGQYMFLLGTAAYHEETKKWLSRYAEYGFLQLVTSTSLGRMTRETLEQQDLDWGFLIPKVKKQEFEGSDKYPDTYIATAPVPHALRLSTTTSKEESGSRVGVRHDAPVFLAEVNEHELKNLNLLLQRRKDSLLRRGPNVTTFNGQAATLFDNRVSRPFVVGLKPNDERSKFDPVIKLFQCGTSLKSKAHLRDDGVIDLACELNHSQIVNVESQATLLKHADLDSNYCIQVPEMETVELKFSHYLPKGKALVVATPAGDGNDHFRVMLLSCWAITQQMEYAYAPAKPVQKSIVTPTSATPTIRNVSYESKPHPFDRPLKPKLVKLKIACASLGKDAPAEDPWMVKTLLKEVGYEAEVKGHLEMELNSGDLKLSGKEIVIELADGRAMVLESDETYGKMSAKSGVLTFTNKQLTSVALTGKVELGLFGGIPIHADRALLTRGSEKLNFSNAFSNVLLSGNVQARAFENGEGMAWAADQIKIKPSGSLFLKGNARLEFEYDDLVQTFTGDSVAMNDETEYFEVSGSGTLTLEKGELEETWKGEEIRLHMYGGGVTVDGVAKDCSQFIEDDE